MHCSIYHFCFPYLAVELKFYVFTESVLFGVSYFKYESLVSEGDHQVSTFAFYFYFLITNIFRIYSIFYKLVTNLHLSYELKLERKLIFFLYSFLLPYFSPVPWFVCVYCTHTWLLLDKGKIYTKIGN